MKNAYVVKYLFNVWIWFKNINPINLIEAIYQRDE